MKKILLSFGLCLAVTAGFGQSKEAYKEIRKYYTEKQIKYIEKELKTLLGNDDYTGNRFQIFDDFYCKYEFPKGEKQAIAYFEYFLMPYSEKSPHRGYRHYLYSLLDPQNID
ncbi:hypothetical protein [Ornithobacterium rhinotracheale]|uniref:hypothetical protein n=4 Tax=Ornithobacterium rhinotracheale TaxID=28251 RepID=UPI0004F61669|nr:hypothetical protein [Ornithobacterium rhinotracheale]AIP98531.1 hypothetical protein Q785_00360 [Ornithobacterium rhinotracheale ORT-UMN 88]KGB67732.1 hypothetical protein Q787_00310 [Ornithobacterium rhinotracheale H06-030791]UOH63142.1 hypothetical protein MT993_09015 [Ornithobacterium rhinotracheale]UOH65634.1 hypothetical protein MT999_10615 [Ornithobacterium rhinotracheale]UOH66834.1 hypothetical protein MT999_05310 [Ornithobacterium rhinotracheale]